MSDHDSPPPPKPDPILVIPSESTPPPSVLNRNQKILFGGIGLVLGMLVGALLVSLFIRLMIWLVNGFLGQETVSTDTTILLRIIGLLIGVIVGGLSGYSFATATTTDRWRQFNPFTPNGILVARQAIWSLVAFCIGTLPGGLLATLFVTLFFSVLNSSSTDELSANPDWVRIRTVFVLIGMVIGGIAGVVVSIPYSPEEKQALAKTEASAVTTTEGKTSKTDAASSDSTTAEQQTTDKKLQTPADSSLTTSLLQSVQYVGFLVTNTARLVMPSPIVSTQRSDDTYISETSKTFKAILDKKDTEKQDTKEQDAEKPDAKEQYLVDLDDTQRDIILKNWLPQIEWTNNRANRERDANELIIWWQLVIGALIPFVATAQTPIFGIAGSTVVALLGIFVTILTGLIRFRRPEERWKHYRRLTEDYQRELWNFISLNDDSYKDKNHQAAFKTFNEKMTVLRQNDVRVFLGEVAVSTPAQTQVKPITGDGTETK